MTAVPNTCGTCKYLGPELDDPDDGRRKTGVHHCELIEHNCSEYKNIAATAFVQDGSGYWAALCVKADFGCNKWESEQ